MGCMYWDYYKFFEGMGGGVGFLLGIGGGGLVGLWGGIM